MDTHCSSDPKPQEGVVPLVVIEGLNANTLPWAKTRGSNHNRMGHYRIFPTLLALMGYESAATQRIYGESLVSPKADPFTFNSRFNARLGREPKWVPIDPAALPPPPRDWR